MDHLSPWLDRLVLPEGFPPAGALEPDGAAELHVAELEADSVQAVHDEEAEAVEVLATHSDQLELADGVVVAAGVGCPEIFSI